MIEIVFGAIIISLIACFAYYVKLTNDDRAKLINALIAKTPEQARDLTMADKVAPIKVQPNNQVPDLVPLENVSEDEFDQHIKEQLK